MYQPKTRMYITTQILELDNLLKDTWKNLHLGSHEIKTLKNS